MIVYARVHASFKLVRVRVALLKVVEDILVLDEAEAAPFPKAEQRTD